MKSIPEGLKTKFDFQSTQFSDVRKAVAGSMDNIYVEYRVHSEYSPEASKRAGEEVRVDKEILMIQTDPFSRVPLAVGTPDGKVRCEIEPDVRLKTAELYERFKGQRGSKDTMISDWEAVTDQEKAILAQVGCFTVEQLHSTPKSELYRFGSVGPEFWERADRHIKAKKKGDVTEARRELDLLMEANREMRERDERREREYLAMQERLAAMEKGASKQTPARKKNVGKRPEKSLETEQMKAA